MSLSQSADKMLGKLGHNRAISLLLLAFVLLGLAYSAVNPLHEATDELRHYRFVRYLAVNRRLPVQGQEPCRSQSHHPPLFYVLGALVTAGVDTGRDLCHVPPQNPFWAYRYWEVGVDNKNQYLHGPDEAFPWRGEALAAHLIRAVNVLIGAGVVWLTWAAGRTVWPGRPALALGAAALVAFNPMFLYMAGAINNDIMAALGGAAVLLGCLRLMRDPSGLGRHKGVVLGVLYSLALMSKFNLAVVIVLIEIAVTWVAWRGRQWRLWLEVNLIMALVTALLAGWWFGRNQLLYGEPTGFREVTELWGVRDPRQSLGLALSELPYVWSSLWGRFGFGQIPLPQVIYDGLYWLMVTGLAGSLLLLLPRQRRAAAAWFAGSAASPWWTSLALLALHALLMLAVLFSYMLVSPAGPMGRFFFPGLPALALLLIFGLANLVDFGFWIIDISLQGRGGGGRAEGRSARSRLSWLAGMVTVGMLGLALVALFGYLAPAYARPAELDLDAAVPNPVDARFDALATLLGYEITPEALRPGEPLDVRLYWEVNNRPAGDYLLFVHLVDEAGVLVAQRDTHPGLGSFPTSQWRPGDRFVESIRVYLLDTAYAPETIYVRVGLYEPGAFRLAVTAANGQPLGDSVTLGTARLAAREGRYPNAQDQNFNNEIRLAGYEYERRQAAPGEPVAVILYWEALQDVTADYVVQVRLLDENGRTWAAADSRPQMGGSPTGDWTAGQAVADRHVLMVDPAAPPGGYFVDIALQDGVSGRRQNIVAPDGHWIDNHLLLARLLVRP